MTENTDNRSECIAGLRAMADLLEATDALPLPEPVNFAWNVWGNFQDDVPAEVARIAKLLPGRLDKNDPTVSDFNGRYYQLTGKVGGLTTEICAYREMVCERVVTGSETVTKTVPAPDAPTVEVTETVETVEWICKPILAKAAS